MTLAVRVVPIEGPMPDRVDSARASWATRRGLLVLVEGADGLVGRGEIAPLPGYSTEGLADAQAFLRRLKIEDPDRFEAAPAWPSEAPSSVCFGVESALLDLLAQRAGGPRWRQIDPGAGGPGPRVTALVTSIDVAGARTRALAAIESGVIDLKVKVGREGRFEEEQAVLRTVRACLPAEGSLRVDANRAFSAEELPGRLEALATLGVSLVEEPAALEDVEALRECPVPLAVDESLRDPGELDRALALIEQGRVTVAVIKPAVLGGLVRAHQIARRLAAAGATVSVSHLFDGPAAHRAYAALALALRGPAGAQDGPHGLGHHAGLTALAASDDRRGPHPIIAGRLVEAE